MSFEFDASKEFRKSLEDIETLRSYAINEGRNDNEKNRLLFLKLSVVSSVTKFQVFIESILKEFLYIIRTSDKKYGEIELHLRLNSIKLFTFNKVISKKLENHETYSESKLEEVREIVTRTLSFCNDRETISDELLLETKFPLGKTGLEELTKLFRQINGENIFDSPPFDINTLNEILGRRHAIIHEDSNSQLTEEVVIKYRDYLLEFIA